MKGVSNPARPHARVSSSGILVAALLAAAGIATLTVVLLSDRPASRDASPVEADAFLADPASSGRPIDPGRADQLIAVLIDRAETAIATGSFGSGPADDVSAMLERIEVLAPRASPVGRKAVLGMPDRLAARSATAAAAGRFAEARRLEQFSHFRIDVTPIGSIGRSDGSADLTHPRQGPAALVLSALDPVPTTPETLGRSVLGEPLPRSQPDAKLEVALPLRAPLHIVLAVAGGEPAHLARAADLQRALLAAGLKVGGLGAADARLPSPGIGYYFQSDRDSAVDVSLRLRHLLGRVDPFLLPSQGRMPQPGTVEVVVP